MAGVGQGLDWGPPIGAIGIPDTHTAIFRVDYHLMIGLCAPQTNKKKILMSVCYIKHSCQILTAATVYAKISVSGKTFWREKKSCISKT